jgi:hypothetical protein
METKRSNRSFATTTLHISTNGSSARPAEVNAELRVLRVQFARLRAIRARSCDPAELAATTRSAATRGSTGDASGEDHESVTVRAVS